MISKELFCEVMKIDIEKLTEFEYKVNMASGTGIFYFIDNENIDDEYEFINIYELAHKCKEWARNRDYSVTSGNRTDGTERYDAMCVWKDCDIEEWDDFFSGIFDTEPEAIFKACEWILKQSNNDG